MRFWFIYDFEGRKYEDMEKSFEICLLRKISK